jgi:hypothetical protein
MLDVYQGRGLVGISYPGTLSQRVKTQLVGDLGGVHGVLKLCQQRSKYYWIQITDWQILLVGEDQKNGISELILVQHALQFLSGLNNTIAIIAVNNEDDALSVLEVMSPQRSDLVLSTDIPYSELNVLIFDSLNVET